MKKIKFLIFTIIFCIAGTTFNSTFASVTSNVYNVQQPPQNNEAYFNLYIRELESKIKINWDPPTATQSKQVVLLLKIAKDGKLLSVRVFKSSGIPSFDRTALQAVQFAAPFSPLPAGFRGGTIDIQVTLG